ncbi:response regulator [Acetivibrio ethanolgignens]|uniref:Stage 0 sporulation protein A homolog n=1 Tax=Acetivibrio ethanolgignens TaxID=290052 RepID=A0A0V8QE23_9FIRM|nr:response regulator transcription factor [Acetivibrio ethanolgignens]KSV58833.1 two-component system response regulator [Acetivibrio ethanolgignens]
MPINIAIVDDHSMIREGLKQLLELDGEVKVIAEANDGVECMEMLQKQVPDILLLDINMPQMNGIQVLEMIQIEKIKVKILILTIHNEIEYLMKAVEIGINGYVLKDSDISVLKKAIYAINRGESYIEPSLTPYFNKKLEKKKERRLDSLSKREIQVLELIAEGNFNKEIAEKLFISEKTVKNHVSSIFKKIDVSDRTQAAIYAIKNGIVELR